MRWSSSRVLGHADVSLRRRSIIYSGLPPPVVTYVDDKQNTSGTGSPLTGLSFGAADPKRYLVAAIGHSSATAATAVTIGGVAATKLIDANDNNRRTCIWIALVPTGTSGNITITAGLGGVTSVALYSIVGLNSITPIATDTDITSPLNMSVAVRANGVVIATAYFAGSPDASATISGLTGDLNLQFNGGVEHHSVGHFQAASAGSKSLSFTLGGIGNYSGCAVSLR